MMKEKIDLPYDFGNGLRADKVDQGLLKRMKETGCKLIRVGVENADPKTYRYVNKGESLDAVEAGMRMIKKAGIPLQAFMVIGLPHTTMESVKRSMDFLDRLGVKASWYIATPFKGTQLYDWVQKNARVYNVNYSRSIAFFTPQFDTLDFSKDERIKAYLWANIRHENFAAVLIGKNFLEKRINALRYVCRYSLSKLPKYVIYIIKTTIKKMAEKLFSR
jgi:radical SAM superfamily enzyme YgiQ (UPF0313 family)